MKRKKFIIAIAVIAVALGYLGYSAFASSATYYYTVSEFRQQPDAFSDKAIRISGIVAEGSIENKEFVLNFIMTEGADQLAVEYKGMVPDAFKAGAEAVVEGKLNDAGVFEAKTLLAKCPSKYEPETPAQQ